MTNRWKLCCASILAACRAFAYTAYVANSGDGTVSVIDTATNSMIGSPIPVGTTPWAIALTPDELFAYVVNQGSNDVSVIDTATNTVVGMPIPVGNSPFDIEIVTTINGIYAYVSSQSGMPGSNITVIDTANQMIVMTIPIVTGPIGLTSTPDGMYVYSADSTTNDVAVIDTSTNTVVGLPIPAGTFPYGIDIAQTVNGLYAYVANDNSHDVIVINTATNMVVGAPIVGGPGVNGLAFTPDTSYLYITNQATNQVYILDTATNVLVGSPIAVGPSPVGIAIFTGGIPQPPASLSGSQRKNDFAVVYEYFNLLQWTASPSASLVAGYAIYRDGSRIGAVDAGTLEYRDHNRPKGTSFSYSVRAFNAAGQEGAAISVTVQ